MRKPSPRLLKYAMLAFALIALASGMLAIIFRTKQTAPLPFDTKQFVSTTNFLDSYLANPPANETVFRKCYRLFFRELFKFGGSKASSSSFPAAGKGLWGVQPLLNDCMVVTGMRYLMPREIAAGNITFGHTNTLDGPHYVALVEDTLQHGKVEYWKPATNGGMNVVHQEPLKFLPFPGQKTVVVLPQSEVADFLRTNGIDPHKFEKDSKEKL